MTDEMKAIQAEIQALRERVQKLEREARERDGKEEWIRYMTEIPKVRRFGS